MGVRPLTQIQPTLPAPPQALPDVNACLPTAHHPPRDSLPGVTVLEFDLGSSFTHWGFGGRNQSIIRISTPMPHQGNVQSEWTKSGGIF